MAVYAIWNNKGGVGKSYLTFQIASEYARTHPNQKLLVIDPRPGVFGVRSRHEFCRSKSDESVECA